MGLGEKVSVAGFAFMGEMGLDIVLFTVPLYAQFLGASTPLIGFIGAAYGLSYLFSASVMPRVYGLTNKNVLLFGSLLCYSAVVAGYLVLRNPVLFLALRAGEGVALGVFWPIADTVPSERASGKTLLEWYNTGWSSAAFMAPYLSGALIAVYGLLSPIYVAVTLEVFNAVISMVAVRVPEHIRRQRLSGMPRPSRETILLVVLPSFTSAYVAGVVLSLFPAYLRQLGIGYDLIGLVAGSAGLTRTVTFAVSGVAERKIGAGKLLALGFTSLAAIAAASITGDAYALLLIMLAVGFGLGSVFHVGLGNAVKDKASAVEMTSMFETSLGAGLFLGPLLGGVVGYIQPALVYAVTGAVAAAGGLAVWMGAQPLKHTEK